jgi:hypothetical protein
MGVYVLSMPEVDLFGNPIFEERTVQAKKAEAGEKT